MTTKPSGLLTFTEARQRLRTHPLRLAEIPQEFAVSLPLPTRRWREPAYAVFAGPAIRRPGQPTEHDPPDRWWVMAAQSGHTLIYALTRVQHFCDTPCGRVAVSPQGTLVEVQQALERAAASLDRLAPLFFVGEPGGADDRRALYQALASLVPPPLLPQYRALTPDFFAWLEA